MAGANSLRSARWTQTAEIGESRVCLAGRMAVDAVGGAARPKWSLTQEAFDGLLASFGPDRDETANRYLEVRRNLIRLFEWRGCSAPDELADETINRCARKIGEGEQIRDVPTYCIGIARMLLREAARERAREAVPWDRVPEPRTPPAEAGHDMDHREACLRRCLAQLHPRITTSF